MVKVRFNEKVLKGLDAGWQVPLEGSEAAAVASVKKQMKSSGLDPKEPAVRQLVREVREKVGK